MASIASNELQIRDRIYNVEKFIRRHPGGSILKSKLGNDATEAYLEFHYRSERAERMLKTIPSRPAKDNTDPLVRDFRILRQELIDEGMFEPSYIHVAYRLLEVLAIATFGYQLVLRDYFYTGLFLIGIAAGRAGWVQHEGNHNSLTGNMFVDKLIGSFYFSMGEAGSAKWWIASHNRHHASPQHIGYDADLNTLPLLAFDRITATFGSPGWLQYQAYGFIPSTWVVVLFWKLYLHPYAIIRKRAISDGVFLVFHYAVFYYLFSYMGWPKMIYAHFIWGSVEGSYLFTNFALSHTHKPIIEHEDSEDWVRAAILRTVNIRPNFLVNWWMGYLNCQIEHHLFPTMPQFRIPYIVPRIKELAAKHDIEYDERNYWETCCDMFGNLNEVGNSEEVGKMRHHEELLKKTM